MVPARVSRQEGHPQHARSSVQHDDEICEPESLAVASALDGGNSRADARSYCVRRLYLPVVSHSPLLND